MEKICPSETSTQLAACNFWFPVFFFPFVSEDGGYVSFTELLDVITYKTVTSVLLLLLLLFYYTVRLTDITRSRTQVELKQSYFELVQVQEPTDQSRVQTHEAVTLSVTLVQPLT
jgi:hypothetical protein